MLNYSEKALITIITKLDNDMSMHPVKHNNYSVNSLKNTTQIIGKHSLIQQIVFLLTAVQF